MRLQRHVSSDGEEQRSTFVARAAGARWSSRQDPDSVGASVIRTERMAAAWLGRISFTAWMAGACPGVALAQDSERGAEGAIVVVLRLGPEVGETERNAIAAHLADLPIDLRMRSPEGPSEPNALELALMRTDGGWTLVRRGSAHGREDARVIEDEGSPTTTSEALGVTLRAAIKDAIVRPPTPAPEPAGRIPPEGERRRGVRLQAMYIGSSYAPQKVWLNGFQPSLGWYARWGLGVRIAYSVFAPIEATSPLGSVRVQRHPIEVMLGWDRTMDWVGWAIELGAVIDPQRRTAEGADPDVRAASRHWSTDGALAVRARLGFRGGWWEVFIGAGAELWLRPEHVAAADARGRTTLLAPSRWRGQVGAGVAIRL